MAGGARGRKATPSAETIRKERDALELRRAGVTYDVIAERVGYANKGGAYKAVQAALKRTLQEPADELRTLETDRLDRLLSAIWPAAMKGDVRAVDRILRIAERRAKLLGLDRAETPDLHTIGLLQATAAALGLTDVEDAQP